MTTFHIPDMTCGHCAGKIARAIAGVDPAARTEVNVAGRLVSVGSAAAAAEIAEAIREAGYTPQQVEAAPPDPVRASGCCCASRKAAAADVPQASATAGGACCG